MVRGVLPEAEDKVADFARHMKAGRLTDLREGEFGIILGAVFLVIGIIVAIIIGTVFAGLIAQCADLGPGTHYVDGVTYTCS